MYTKCNKHCSTCLEFQQMQPKYKMVQYKLPGKPWKIIKVDLFNLNNRNFLSIVDYFRKFPIIMCAEKLSADSLIVCCKVVFAEYGLPKNIMSGMGTNLILKKSQNFLWKAEHEIGSVVIISAPKQCPSQSMHKFIRGTQWKNVRRLITT